MLRKYYQVGTPATLKKFINVYIPLVLNIADSFSVDLTSNSFVGDHLGLQVLSSQEFNKVDEELLNYCSLIHDNVIHERRNRVYKFNIPIVSSGVSLQSIEIFEPKPNADVKKLKPGIEHVAFVSKDFDKTKAFFQEKDLPIDKFVEYPNGEKFFKTKLINMVEIEFRNKPLGIN